MKTLYLCMTICVLSLGSPLALADGNKLLKQCTDAVQTVDGRTDGTYSVERTYNLGFCFGLLQGITQTNAAFDLEKRADSPFMCLPQGGIQNVQAARIVVKFLNEHPEFLHMYETPLAMKALHDAFPCSKTSH